MKLVYTPLNGSGLECVKKLLAKLGVTHVTVVPEQEKPDGNFPTCPYPNPEIREAMQKGLELCDTVHPDLLLGTDPDCDRCGTAVPDGKGGYRLITGNEMGIILLDAINKLYAEFGCYRNALLSFAFEGESGMHTMQAIMKKLRETPPAEIGGIAVESVLDYNTEGTGLPKANVLEFRLAGGAKLMVRPSGTEPKIKVYLSAVAPTEEAADAINAKLSAASKELLQA
mgnify:FL=1